MEDASGTDQIWAPIEGVTIERYAGLSRDMAAGGVVGPEAVEHWVTERGVAAGAWSAVTMGWSSRMIRFAEVRRRFDELVADEPARRPTI
jgi:hypothetical protein